MKTYKNLSKRSLLITSLLGAVIASGTSAFAATITVDGSPVNFNPGPIERTGRIFVPLRGVFERLGASVVYENGSINATSPNHSVSLRIGSNSATIDGQQKSIDVAPFIIGSSTYVPLRFVSESLGSVVNYDSRTQVVALSTPVGPQDYTSPQQSYATPAPVYQKPQNQSGAILKNVNPSRNSFTNNQQPVISADFTQSVNPNTITVILDGLDITNQTSRSESGLSYQPPSPLQPMRHTLNVYGNLSNDSRFNEAWNFSTNNLQGNTPNQGNVINPNQNTTYTARPVSITSPANNSSIESTFTITGKAASNALIHFEGASSTSIGGILSISTGNYASDTTADAAGNFSKEINIQANSGSLLTMSVTAKNPRNGQVSQTSLRFQIQ